jgi:hypothetical protein
MTYSHTCIYIGLEPEDQFANLDHLRESLHSNKLSVQQISRAFSIARSVLRFTIDSNKNNISNPSRDRVLGEQVFHGCCRDSAGEAITTTLMLALSEWLVYPPRRKREIERGDRRERE